MCYTIIINVLKCSKRCKIKVIASIMRVLLHHNLIFFTLNVSKIIFASMKIAFWIFCMKYSYFFHTFCLNFHRLNSYSNFWLGCSPLIALLLSCTIHYLLMGSLRNGSYLPSRWAIIKDYKKFDKDKSESNLLPILAPHHTLADFHVDQTVLPCLDLVFSVFGDSYPWFSFKLRTTNFDQSRYDQYLTDILLFRIVKYWSFGQFIQRDMLYRWLE